MADIEVHLESGKMWAPAGDVIGIPACLCGEPLLMIGGFGSAYGYCIPCKQYYTTMDCPVKESDA